MAAFDPRRPSTPPVWLEPLDVEIGAPGWRTIKPSLPQAACRTRPQSARARMTRESTAPSAAGAGREPPPSRSLKPQLPREVYGRRPQTDTAADTDDDSRSFVQRNAWVMLNRKSLPNAPQPPQIAKPANIISRFEESGRLHVEHRNKAINTEEQRTEMRAKVEREKKAKEAAERHDRQKHRAAAKAKQADKAAALAERVAEYRTRLARRAILVSRREQLRINKFAMLRGANPMAEHVWAEEVASASRLVKEASAAMAVAAERAECALIERTKARSAGASCVLLPAERGDGTARAHGSMVLSTAAEQRRVQARTATGRGHREAAAAVSAVSLVATDLAAMARAHMEQLERQGTREST